MEKKIIEQPLYDVMFTDLDEVKVTFIDFLYGGEDNASIDFSKVPGPDICEKNIKLISENIILKDENSISNFLNNKFLKEALELGDRNRSKNTLMQTAEGQQKLNELNNEIDIKRQSKNKSPTT